MGGPGKPPFWRTLKEFCSFRGLGSVALKNKHSTHTQLFPTHAPETGELPQYYDHGSIGNTGSGYPRLCGTLKKTELLENHTSNTSTCGHRGAT